MNAPETVSAPLESSRLGSVRSPSGPQRRPRRRTRRSTRSRTKRGPRRAVGSVIRWLVAGIPLILVTGCFDEADPNREPPAGGDHLVPVQEAERLASAARERLEASDGGRLVLRAIEAHGGLEAWYRAPTSSYTWEYANVGSDVRFKSFLVADNRTREVYHDLLTTGSYDAPG